MPKVVYTEGKGLVQSTGAGLDITGGSLNWRRKVDNATLNTGGAVTTTLTRAQSGTLFEIDGTAAVIVNMPALSVSNEGCTYEFLVTTAVGAGVTTTFVLPGSGVSDFSGILGLTGNASTCAFTIDVAGDTLTLVNSTVVGTRVKLTCLDDTGAASTWMCDTLGAPVATVD
jgi:hypothetical protein